MKVITNIVDPKERNVITRSSQLSDDEECMIVSNNNGN
jgi:hypothetical protein